MAVDPKANTAVEASGKTVEQAKVRTLSDEVLTLYLAVLTGHSQQARVSVHPFLSQVAQNLHSNPQHSLWVLFPLLIFRGQHCSNLTGL